MQSQRQDTQPVANSPRPRTRRAAALPAVGATPDQLIERTEQLATLGELAAGVAHEVNNLNNSIYFNIPILREYLEALRPLVKRELSRRPGQSLLGMAGPDFLTDLFGLVDHLQDGSTRIADIVSELRDCGRPTNKEREPARPESLVDSVVTLTGRQMRKLVQTFEISVDEPLPLVAVVPGKVEQVLINLLLNAAQAADKPDSRVKLSVRTARRDGVDVVRFRIDDNGGGVSAAAMPRIFEPFFTTKGDRSGTGLGLYISKRIVEEHGGRILVSSEPSHGTTFVVELPVHL